LVETVARQRREAVARAIEDVAIGLFVERPMAAVTAEEIAARAGVAVRTLYRYFATKEHIFTGLPRRGAERLAERMRARPASETPFEALRAAIAGTDPGVDFDGLDLWLRALGQSGATDRIQLMALVASTEPLTEALRERVGPSKDDLWPSVAGLMAAGSLIASTGHWATHGGDLVADQLAAIDIVGEGMAVGPKRRRRA
jgi:AcrR family transcriptional regulator